MTDLRLFFALAALESSVGPGYPQLFPGDVPFTVNSTMPQRYLILATLVGIDDGGASCASTDFSDFFA
jgi:hypothetical protein